MKPLWVGIIPGYEALTSENPVNAPEDLRGTVQRSTGGPQDRVGEEMGAAGVAMPIGDLYETLTRGTVEGTVASPVSITPYGLEEVLAYSTRGANLGSFTSVYVMNGDTWRSLTDEQRAFLEPTSATVQRSLCEELNNAVSSSHKQMEEAGVEFHDVPANSGWARLHEPVRARWAEDLEFIGRPADEVLSEFEDSLARHASDGHTLAAGSGEKRR